MIKTTLYFPDELHTSLKVEAASQKITMTELIVEILEGRDMLTRLPQKSKEKAVKVLSTFESEAEKKKFESGLTKNRGEFNSDDYL